MAQNRVYALYADLSTGDTLFAGRITVPAGEDGDFFAYSDAVTTVLAADGKSITETCENRRLETEFVSDDVVLQKYYEDNTLLQTKRITVAADGSTITEVIE